MTETTQDQRVISLQAELVGIVAAMNMHIKRAEELAGEMERIVVEISQLTPEAQA